MQLMKEIKHNVQSNFMLRGEETESTNECTTASASDLSRTTMLYNYQSCFVISSLFYTFLNFDYVLQPVEKPLYMM